MSLRYIFLGLFMGATAAYAVDYDYERAYAQWQRLQSVADNKEADWNQERRELVPLQTAYDNAVRNVTNRENQLQGIRTQIRNKQDVIAETERTIETLERDRDRFVSDNRRLRDEIDDMHDDHDRLEDVIDDLIDDRRDLERRIRDLEGDPDNSELERLRRQLVALNADISAKQRELANCERDINQLQASIDFNDRGISDIDRRLPGLRNNLRTYESQLRDLFSDENNAEIALSRARDDQNQTRTARDRQQLIVDRAYDDYRNAEYSANEAESYYQTVLGNYNRAMTAAQNHGDSTGGEHGNREASARAESPATSTAVSHATRDGQAQGASEAAAISHARGYRYGRDNAAAQSSYAAGVAQGEAIARDKAQGETFPVGYNEALFADLSQAPSSVETIDITDLIPDLPDAGGTLLSSDQKSIRNVAEPAFSFENEPEFSPPEPSTQSVSAPSADRRFYAPQCNGQPLAVFVQACERSYESAYVGQFASLYRSAYNAIYRSVYREEIPAIYRAARDQRDNGAYAEGTTLGARHQGILVGFAQEIQSATAAAYTRGRQAYVAYEATGYLPLIKEVSLDEGYEDDNLSPGEAIKLKVKIDNYGTLASSPEQLTIKIEDLSGGTFDLEIRDLPAMQGDTSTILEGVLKGQVTAQDSGAVRFKVSLVSAGGSVLDEAIFAGDVQSPIVLSRVEFPEAVQIGEETQGLLHIENRTSRGSDATSALLSVSPDLLDLLNPELEIGAIGPDSSITVPFDFTADVRAGGNIAMNFGLKVNDIAGSPEVNLAKSATIAIDRNASIALCLPTCGAQVNLPLRVRAGSTLSIPALFDFHATTRQQGPFVIGKLEQSDSRIRGANGSTVRATLGSWGPNHSAYRVNFSYVIPRELAGQQHWVSLYIDDGNERIHLVNVPFLVE